MAHLLPSLLHLLVQDNLRPLVLEWAGARAYGTTTEQDFETIEGRSKADCRGTDHTLSRFVSFLFLFSGSLSTGLKRWSDPPGSRGHRAGPSSPFLKV